MKDMPDMMNMTSKAPAKKNGAGADSGFNIADHMELFHILFDANHIGMTVVRPDGTIIYYNKAQSILDSLPQEKAIGKKICEVYDFTPEDSPTMQALASRKVVSDKVHFYRTRNGKLVNSTCDVYPLLRNGELTGALCCIHGYALMDRQICAFVDVRESDEQGMAAVSQPSSTKTRYRFSSLIGQNTQLKEAISIARKAAKSSSPIMLVGSTGVGKEIFAQSIHDASPRGKHQYTAINCSAVPENLLEGILFGTTKGSFTGAIDKVGLFEMTNKGTLFLDELDSMPISLQSKLLRVLQEKTVRRIGDSRERELDVRIISSVSRNPVDCVNERRLRPDFYYRLGVVKIFIPPLKQRLDDLHLLAQHFVNKHSSSLGMAPPLITPEAMGILYNHDWPGNVRELEHVIEASLNLLDDDSDISPDHILNACPDIFTGDELLPSKTTPWLAYQEYVLAQNMKNERNGNSSAHDAHRDGPPNAMTGKSAKTAARPERDEEGLGLLDRKHNLEEETIRNALRSSAGNMALAARLMRISPQLMQYKVKKYGIRAKDYVPGSL